MRPDSNRIVALDSARGTAMLLVCLSHFAVIYSESSGVSFDDVYYFTMMAAPTFMVISGILLGFFYTTKKALLSSLSVITLIEESLF